MDLSELFNKMYSYYGSQNWWPGEGFEIVIGAILTQNTSWSNVEKAINNLRSRDILTPQKILATDLEALKKLIKPAGFFNQKAHYLRNVSDYWLTNSTPTRKQLVGIKGIGEETADSILLYLFNQPEFVIDAYTIRICNRLGYNDSKNKHFWKEYFENKLPKNSKLFNEFHALFVIHAKTYCKKNNPECLHCFLHQDCTYAKQIKAAGK